MKVELRVPTDQYAYIGITYDQQEVLTDDKIMQAVDAYRRTARLAQRSTGIPTKEFNKMLDEYLTTNTVSGGSEKWHLLSEPQQMCFQEIKKSLKRITKPDEREFVTTIHAKGLVEPGGEGTVSQKTQI